MYIQKKEGNFNNVVYVYDESLLNKNKSFIEIDSELEPPDERSWILSIPGLELNNATWTLQEEVKNIALEKIKTEKIKETKEMLALFLLNNPLLSDIKEEGVFKNYSVTEEKQTLLVNTLFYYLRMEEEGIETDLAWNASGEESETWELEKLMSLYNLIIEYIKPFVEYQRTLENNIKDCETIEAVSDFEINYYILIEDANG